MITETSKGRNGYGHGYLARSLRALLFGSHLNALLVCTPFAFLAQWLNWGDGWVFVLSLLSIAPFAERLSFVTEQLAMHTSETLGGLLNATFGNVTELIVSLFALRSGLLRIVQVSLLGSILSNLLLVLGCAFLAGGIKFREQSYNRIAASMNASMLALGTMCLLFPMVLTATHEELDVDSSLVVSRASAAMMLLVYCSYLVFQLKTHTHLYEGDSIDDDEDERVLGASGAVFWLAVITSFIAILSEYMVDAIRGAAAELQVPDLFLGTIIIPIVGNAAEHAAAIIFAAKNKMELSLGIAVGSATQISLFVVPLCVVIAWVADIPLSLDFHPFETGCLLLTVMLVSFITQTGHSNWLQGLTLIVAYLIVAVGFFYHVDKPAISSSSSAPDEL
ncbi:hypothetical protein AB1Y20_006260 [Prymnesium parvum]|uniref:Sodium/calcium exchanger membrane region domain-containing protein n=1 Tax=Prymnesium parvum TaxID=97485 RepID=A0AB34J4M5_PRYPA